MSLLHESGPDDQQLIRYLLGQLPEEDAEILDEASIADDEIAGRLRVVEDDLVDAYASGNLAGESLQRFESYYLSSPRRREKVRFAGSLLRTVNQPAALDTAVDTHVPEAFVAEPPRVRPFSPKQSILRRSESWWQLAAIAALFVLGCGALLLWGARLRSGLSQAERQSAVLERRARELEQQLLDQRAANAEAAKELARVRASMAELARQGAGDGAPERSGSAAQTIGTIAVVLLPQTRGVGPVTALAVPQGMARVSFELRLESNEFPLYQVVVRDPATNQAIWRSDRLAATSAGDQPAVVVAVPAGLLKAQHYSLELIGQGAAGRTQIVGSYIVQIVSR
jgi:hypothetical protein